MPHHDEHPAKAAALRDGELVVHPDAAISDCTVWFAYEPERWEGLLAVRTGADTARICGIPFWVYDLNLGDEVRVVASADGALVAEQRVREAPTYTFRVVFDQVEGDDHRWLDLMRDLAAFGCWFDVRSPGYVALAVPEERAQSVADLLAAWEQAGRLHYETGRTS